MVDAFNAYITRASVVGLGPRVSVKDLIDVAGFPTTAGRLLTTARWPVRDATVIANLRSSGAAIVGKTNLYELGVRGFERERVARRGVQSAGP